MKLTNRQNIGVVLAAAVLYSDYDGKVGGVSATTLLKSPRQIVKTIWANKEGNQVKITKDISDFFVSFLGSSMHSTIELVWKNEEIYKPLLRMLGYSKKQIKGVVVNPSKSDLKKLNKKVKKKNQLVIFVETRASMILSKILITGKYDYIVNGRLYDLKTTSTFITQKILRQSHDARRIMKESPSLRRVELLEEQCPDVFKYTMQGSIYKVMNPDKITESHMTIQSALKDWQPFKVGQDFYPRGRLIDQSFKLFTKKETIKWVTRKLKQINSLAENYSEEELPECTKNELWQSDSVWKYYASETSNRATKVFGTDASAAFAWADGKTGIVKEIHGEVRACNYCEHVNNCSQADRLEASGLLKKQ